MPRRFAGGRRVVPEFTWDAAAGFTSELGRPLPEVTAPTAALEKIKEQVNRSPDRRDRSPDRRTRDGPRRARGVVGLEGRLERAGAELEGEGVEGGGLHAERQGRARRAKARGSARLPHGARGSFTGPGPVAYALYMKSCTRPNTLAVR